MLRSERDKETIIQSLSEMFNWMSRDELRKICEENLWSMESCIDKLINFGNQNNVQQIAAEALPQQSAEEAEFADFEVMPKKKPKSNFKEIFGPEFDDICQMVLKGYKVLVLMRGAPGCGKSYLAAKIIETCDLLKDGYTLQDFIFSTDDYFYDRQGNYVYKPDRLEEAHAYNKDRVFKKAKEGWSPIVIDNTNMQVWEMGIYVQIAVQQGYLLRILEPNTPWRNSASKLAARNSHNVPRMKIQRILEKYEPATVDDLLKMMKQVSYTVPLPQMRNYPMLVFRPSRSSNAENIADNAAPDFGETAESEKLKPLLKSTPKGQRERNNKKGSETTNNNTSNTWKPYEEEASNFWFSKDNNNQQNQIQQQAVPIQASINDSQEPNKDAGKNILELLKENVYPSSNESKEKPAVEKTNGLVPHNVGCPNEDPSFIILRQVYPNQDVSSLWDLFVKCNGNINWAADVLLKEEDSFVPEVFPSDSSNQPKNFDNICNCALGDDDASMKVPFDCPMQIEVLEGPSTSAKPARNRSNRSPKNQHKKSENFEIKQEIENKFIFPQEQYPDGVRKFREKFRNPQNTLLNNSNNNNNNGISTISSFDSKPATVNVAIQKDFQDEETNDNNSEELQELSLGVELVSQLQEMFKGEYYLSEKVTNNLNTNIFIPRSLAKQLFMLWMESAYNQMEEENQKILREDEYFARLLKNPKYEDYMESPNNLHELLDKNRLDFEGIQDGIQGAENDYEFNQVMNHDLATKLTHMKLCEQFPYIPQDTVFDIFSAHHNDYTQTLKALEATIGLDLKPDKEQNDSPDFNQKELSQDSASGSKDSNKDESPDSSTKRKLRTTEESKHLALREFEDTRNMAAHHCQLKAECYEKARDAISRGKGGVAAYYSQIAAFHKTKIDMYNNRAANCIMEVHKHTQNNPDLLDLHYLHVVEAIGCLDIFIDQHITNLRNASRSYKHLFIITGRGLHSIGGVSSIKNKVKTRLRERFLRWTEVNPGLLKIKLFSTSRFTTDI